MRRAQNKDAGPRLWKQLSSRVEEGITSLETAGSEAGPLPITAYPATRLDNSMTVIVYAAKAMSFSAMNTVATTRRPPTVRRTQLITPLIQAARLAFTV